MELGLDFGDDDFESKKASEQKHKTSYNAKFCTELWYNSETPDPDNAGVIYKFRGDNQYHNQQYIAAIGHYKEALDNLPLTNKVLRQDILECMARSYLHAEKFVEALDLTQNLVMNSKTTPQILQTKLLLSRVQEKMQDFDGMEESLKHLLTMYPYTYSLWMKLGHCYLGQMEKLGQNIPGYLQIQLKRLTCLIRARLLIKNILRNAESAFKPKLIKLSTELEADQKSLDVSESLVSTATKHLREDICQNEESSDETIENNDKSADVLPQTDQGSFVQKWFSWIENEQCIENISA